MWLLLSVLCPSLFLQSDCVIHKGSITFIQEYLIFEQIKVVFTKECSNQDGFRLRKALTTDLGFWLESCRRLEDVVDHLGVGVGVVVDRDCEQNQRYLEESSSAYLYNSTLHCLIISRLGPDADDLSTFNFNIASRVTWASVDDSSTIHLHDIYKLQYELPAVVLLAGSWTAHGGLNYALTRYSVRRRGNMAGATLKSALVVYELPLDDILLRLASHVNQELDMGARFYYAVLKDLATMFNFKLHVEVTNSWGYLDPLTGVMNGVVGMLIRRDIDISGSALVVMPNRLEAADILAPLGFYSSDIYFVHPKSLGVHGALFAPFTAHVWLATAAMSAAMIVVMRAAWWLERPVGCEPGSWSGAMLIAVGAFGLQGTAQESSTYTWRLVLLTVMLMAFFYSNFYSAYIVGSLLMPTPRTIHDLRTLIDSPLLLGAEDLPYTKSFFEVRLNQSSLFDQHEITQVQNN